MADESLYIAVDLGAGSGRVFLVGFGERELMLEEIRRFHYPPRLEAGHLRWDIRLILSEIVAGLRDAALRARVLRRPVASIGIDSWGVDYGLVDAAGRLVADPVCYRDPRTNGVMERVFARVSREEIFARTGIQFLQFNTLYQLYAHVAEGLPSDAAHLLLIPDLLVSQLTGRIAAEYTNATTTQMVSAADRMWDTDLLDRLDLPVGFLPPIVGPGEYLAPLARPIAGQTGLPDVPIVAVATHDTGSAVAGAPLDAGWAYVSSGTWSLVGVEREAPLIDAAVARENFTNEGGAYGTTRFLKNVMGLWILESCRREWKEAGEDVEYASLLADPSDGDRAVIFPDDPRLLNPDSMLEALARQLGETGQRLPGTPAAMARMVLDSLALRYASVLRGIQDLTDSPLGRVRIVGGGSRSEYLNLATAAFAGIPVVAGPVEATVLGNAAVQAVAAGRFPSLADARRHIGTYTASRVCEPSAALADDGLSERYAGIEALFTT